MTERRVATVLVQAANPRPGAARAIEAALTDHGPPGITEISPTLGAFDAVVTVHGPNPDAIAATVVRIQELDAVGQTLTLAHIEPAT